MFWTPCWDVLNHQKMLMYDSIVESVLISRRPFYKHKVRMTVKELHAEARRAFKVKPESGRNKQIYFKYALQLIKRNENTMRSDSLVRKLQNKS